VLNQSPYDAPLIGKEQVLTVAEPALKVAVMIEEFLAIYTYMRNTRVFLFEIKE
jgi:hypothetical protein